MGINVDHFSDQKGADGGFSWRDLWKYVDEYSRMNGMSTPNVGFVEDRFPGLDLPDATAVDLESVVSDLKNRMLRVDLGVVIEKHKENLSEMTPIEYLTYLSEKVDAMKKKHAISRAFNLHEAFDAAIRRYQKIADGEMLGLPYYWPSVNRMTLGAEAGTLNLVSARTGVGKTFFMLRNAAFQWMEWGKWVHFDSAEMILSVLGTRMLAMLLKVSLSDLRNARLTEQDREEMKRIVAELHAGDSFTVTTGFGKSVGDLASVVESTGPDAVYIDGGYLRLAPPSMAHLPDHIRLGWVFNEYKTQAISYNIPYFVSHQISRGSAASGKNAKAADLGTKDLAGSDQIGWVADSVFSLLQSPDMKMARQMAIVPIKIREGYADVEQVLVNWDMTAMNFAEIGKENEFEDTDFNFGKNARINGSGLPAASNPGTGFSDAPIF